MQRVLMRFLAPCTILHHLHTSNWPREGTRVWTSPSNDSQVATPALRLHRHAAAYLQRLALSDWLAGDRNCCREVLAARLVVAVVGAGRGRGVECCWCCCCGDIFRGAGG